MRRLGRAMAKSLETKYVLQDWEPSIAVKLTILFHSGIILGFVLRPAMWPWLLAAVIANHLMLAVFSMWPRSGFLGRNLSRLPEACINSRYVALTFDDGPDPMVTPRVLEVLDRYKAKASFFCVARRAARYPDLIREIVRRGHSVENHSNRHPAAFACYGPRTLYRELTKAQRTLADITGSEPQFFRAPFGLRNPFLDPVLAWMKLSYVSWTRRGFDSISRSPDKVLVRLARRLSAGDILLLHDRGSVRPSVDRPVVLEVLPRLLDHLAQRGLRPVSLPIAVRSSHPHGAGS